MDDAQIVQLYWDRNEQAIHATSDKYLAGMMWNRHLTKRNSRKPLIHFWIVYHQRKEAFLSADTGTQIAFQKLLSDTI